MISGTDEISPTTVLNSLTFRPGDLYRRSTVLESQRNLYESNLFRLASIQVPETFDSLKTVHVLLREAQLHEARISAGFNTVDFFQAEGRFTHYNLLGGARRLDATATVGNLFASSLERRPGSSVCSRSTPTLTGSTERVPAADVAGEPAVHAAGVAAAPEELARRSAAFAQRRTVPAVVIDRGYGGERHLHALARPARAGEPRATTSR